MKKKRFTEEQIIRALKKYAAGRPQKTESADMGGV
jgi:hypothetical protein